MSYTRTVDGFTVDEDRCRISGQAHVEPEDASAFHVGSDVVVVMLARVTGPTFKESKGDITRINVLKPLEIRTIADEDFRKLVVEELHFDYASVGDDPPSREDVEPEIEFETVEPEVVLQVKANREEPQEPFLDYVDVDDDDDSILDTFILAAEAPKRTPVGGGKFATGKEADRVREFLDE